MVNGRLNGLGRPRLGGGHVISRSRQGVDHWCENGGWGQRLVAEDLQIRTPPLAVYGTLPCLRKYFLIQSRITLIADVKQV